MSDDDYCVYARNVLGMLDQIPNRTSGFTADITRETTQSGSPLEANMGLLVTGALVLIFCIMAFLKRREARPQSKLE